MRIRRLQQTEHVNTRTLYEEVFPEDSKHFVDYYYAEKTKDNVIYVVEEAEEIVAMLHLNPYVLAVNGQEQRAYYIVAVATGKSYRKRGYMAALLRESLRDMREEGVPFTFLMPAAEGIYLPHDFRTVYEQEHRFYREDTHTGMRQADEADARELAELVIPYLAEHYQVYAMRDEAYYRRLIKEYRASDGCLMVREAGGKVTDCRPCLSEEDMKEDAEKPLIMVRVVSPERLLLLLGLQTIMAVCFQVTDPIVEENNRCLMLTGTEFSGVMLMEGRIGNSEGTLTVSALAELVFGVKTVDEIAQESGVQMTERMREELRKIIPLTRIFLNETV